MTEALLLLGRTLLETLVIETAAVLLLKRSGKWLFPCFLGNLLTNPLLNLIYSEARFYLPRPAAWGCLALLEAAAVWYEACLYDGLLSCGKKEALRVSLICNAASFGAGLLIFQVIGRL